MTTSFQKLSVVANRLNRMPINYKNYKGTEFKTYYTTVEFLGQIVLAVGTDNSVEKDYQDLGDSCLREMGFKYLALFTDKLSNEKIAILGI